MAKLEYRLLDEANEFPVLYYYKIIDEEEILLRFACDYFIKEQKLYEKTSAAVEMDTYVVYVKPADRSYYPDASLPAPVRGICVELRQYQENSSYYPLIHTYSYSDERQALLHLLSDFIYLFDQEWEKMFTIIDEDRKAYIFCAGQTV